MEKFFEFVERINESGLHHRTLNPSGSEKFTNLFNKTQWAVARDAIADSGYGTSSIRALASNLATGFRMVEDDLVMAYLDTHEFAQQQRYSPGDPSQTAIAEACHWARTACETVGRQLINATSAPDPLHTLEMVVEDVHDLMHSPEYRYVLYQVGGYGEKTDTSYFNWTNSPYDNPGFKYRYKDRRHLLKRFVTMMERTYNHLADLLSQIRSTEPEPLPAVTSLLPPGH